MGKRIELEHVYRAGQTVQKASTSKERSRPPIPTQKTALAESVPRKAVFVRTIETKMATVSKPSPTMAELMAKLEAVEAEKDRVRASTRERVRKWRTAKVRAKK